ncbi:UNVERIFIED_CONTAM: hypothetical protein HDU68_004378 [Siphonaria sp. JEL0065]|nr:hypothetical protein HDU68_004378 [Siphonaria sp. JEL0065]
MQAVFVAIFAAVAALASNAPAPAGGYASTPAPTTPASCVVVNWSANPNATPYTPPADNKPATYTPSVPADNKPAATYTPAAPADNKPSTVYTAPAPADNKPANLYKGSASSTAAFGAAALIVAALL